MLANQTYGSQAPVKDLSGDLDRIEVLNRSMLYPVSDMEQRSQIELEAEILRAIATAKYLKKDLVDCQG